MSDDGLADRQSIVCPNEVTFIEISCAKDYS